MMEMTGEQNAAKCKLCGKTDASDCINEYCFLQENVAPQEGARRTSGCQAGKRTVPAGAAPDAGDLVAIPDIDPISDPQNADGLIKQLRHAAITDSNATTASPYVCKLLVFAANTIAVLSSNTPCCQDWENCRDRCVPLAEYWKKQAATIAALREEVSRLTDNQRQQDSATAYVMERDEKERDALRTDLAYYQAKWEHELSTVSKLERELAACRDAISAAETIIALGVSLMPLEQLSQWTGVRAWQEFRKGR